MAQIPQYTSPDASFPSPRIAPVADNSAPFDAISKTALGYTAEIVKKDATEQGAIDQGKAGTTPVEKDTGLFGLPTIYSEQYNRAANLAYVSAKKSQLENTVADLQQKYGNDPDQFKTKIAEFGPVFRADVPLPQQGQFDLAFQDAASVATRAVNAVKIKQDFETSKATIVQGIEGDTNRLTNLMANDPDARSAATQQAAADLANNMHGATQPFTDPRTGQTFPGVLDPVKVVEQHEKVIEAVSTASIYAKYGSLPTFADKQSFIDDTLRKGLFKPPMLHGLNDSGSAQVPAALSMRMANELDVQLKQDKATLQGALAMKLDDQSVAMKNFGKSIYSDLPAQIDAAGLRPDQVAAAKARLVDDQQVWQATDSIKGTTRAQDAGTIAALGVQNPNITGPVSAAPSASIETAIFKQEYRGKGTSATSVDGAVGNAQIIPATFARYARAGEDIKNPADNLTVGKRIIADLSNKFGGDPARIAVGYFSGEGNVAPAGSPTPWISDKQDGNGKTVSSYVSDVLGRMGGKPTTPPAFALTDAPGMIAPGNLDPWNRKTLHNDDGSYSTTSSIGITTDKGETVIPTVINGVRFSNADAIDHFKKTGENFGTFKDTDSADTFATNLHNAQASLYDARGNRLVQQSATAGVGIAANSSEREQSQRAYAAAVARKQALLTGSPEDPNSADPARYYESALPGLAASKDPRNMVPYLDKQSWFQQYYGLTDQQQHLLPRADVINLVGQIHDAGEKDPGSVAGQFAQMKTAYGTYWPKVYEQMVTQGKLNPASQAFGLAVRPEDGQWSKALANGLSTGEPKLEEALGSTKTKAIRDQLATSLTDFNTTASAAGADAQLVDTVNHATRVIAMQYALGGDEPTLAATKATDQFLNSRYDFAGSYRVPKGYLATAEQTTNAMQSSITPSDLAPAQPRRGETLTAEQRQGLQATQAKRGIWVTSPSDDGLLLLYPDKSFVQRVDGSRVFVPWTAMNPNARSSYDPYSDIGKY